MRLLQVFLLDKQCYLLLLLGQNLTVPKNFAGTMFKTTSELSGFDQGDLIGLVMALILRDYP